MDIFNFLETCTDKSLFVLSVAICIFLILIIFPILMGKIREKIDAITILLFAIAVIGGCILYFIGYYPINGGFNDYLNSIIKTLISTCKMFLVDNDYETLTDLANNEIVSKINYQILFWAIHLIAFIVVVMTIVSIFGQKLLRKIRIVVSHFKNKYVIYGVNDFSLTLAKDIIRNDKKRVVFFIDDDDINESMLNEIGSLGGIIINSNSLICDGLSVSILNKISMKILNKKLHIFIFNEDEMLNFNILTSVIENLVRYKISNEKLNSIYVKADSSFIHTEIDKYITQCSVNYNINIFNEADLVSRKFIEQFPIYENLSFNNETCIVEAPKCMEILVLGFGEIGKQIVQKIINNGQFIGFELKIIVVDKIADKISGQYISDNPGIFNESMNNVSVIFREFDVKSNKFYEFIKENIREADSSHYLCFDYIISALGNDKINIESMSSIKRIIYSNKVKKLPKLIVYLRNSNYRYFKDNKDDNNKDIYAFGYYEDLYIERVIIDKEFDLLAMAVNESYGGAEWNTISIHQKNSNRATALFIKAYLYIMGLELVYKSDNLNDIEENESKEIFDKTIEKLEQSGGLDNLSKIEHLRWNAFHFTCGWIRKPLEDVTGRNDRKNEYNKLHALLATWEELSLIREKFELLLNKEHQEGKMTQGEYQKELMKCDFYNLDRKNIKDIYAFIKKYNDVYKNYKQVIIKRISN
jgi:hypothetical protein